MNNHIVKAKPQLARTNRHVPHPQNVVVVVNPKQSKVINLKDIKRVQTPKPIKVPTPPVTKAAKQPARQVPLSAVSRNSAVKQKRNSTQRKAQVKYITADPFPESAGRIAGVHRLGRGRILVIIGNGPSITEVELEKLAGQQKIDILSVNKPDIRVWPSKFWAFFDQSQFNRHEEIWNAYDGIMFNSTAIKRQKSTSMQFKNLGGKGWSRDMLKGLHIGRSSVFASMQIAAWMQYEQVYIFGCDMNPEGLNGKLHFYGKNPDVDPKVRKERFAKEAEFYDHAANQMSDAEREKFTFCSAYNPWSFVDKFKKLNHKEAVQIVLDHAAQL